MSYTAGSLVTANDVQTRLEDVFQNAPDSFVAQKVPMLEYIASPQNRGDLTMTVSPGGGKVKTVSVIYQQEINEAAVASDVTNPNCDTGSVHPEVYQDYTIDTTANRASTFSIARTDLDDALTANPAYIEKTLLNHIYAVEKAVASKTATEVVALTGSYNAEVNNMTGYTVTNNQLVVETLQASSNYALAPFAAQQINTAFMMSGFQGPYVGFGGNMLPDYMMRAVAGGTGDIGTNFARMVELYGFSATYDTYARSALGGYDETLFIMPGAVQLLYYTAAGWKDGAPGVIAPEHANYWQTTIVSPRTGIPMDLIVTDNCGTLTYKVIATTKAVGLPTDMFDPSGNFDGVTGVFQVKVTNS